MFVICKMCRLKILYFGCVKWIILLAALLLFTNAQAHPPSTIKMSTEPRDEITAIGRTVTMQCACAGASIRWRHSTDTEPTREHTISDADTHRKQHPNGSLTITMVSSELAGHYQCVASVDGIGTIISRTALVMIAEPPVLNPVSGIVCVANELAVIPCGIIPPTRAALRVTQSPGNRRLPKHNKGYTPPVLDVTVSWYKDKVPVLLDSRTSLSPTGGLELDPALELDAGTYLCVVAVFGNKTVTSDPIDVRVVVQSSEVEYPPRFITVPQSVTIIEGATAAFDCAIAGNPKPEITWLFNGLPIDLNSLDAGWWGSEGWVVGGRAGEVRCAAGGLSHIATLTTQIPPTVSIEGNGVIRTSAGSVVVLRCGAGGKPPPTVTWYKDGDRLTLNHDVTVVDKWSLRISGVLPEDAGMFQCVATSIAGSATANARLVVTKPDNDLKLNSTLKKSKKKKSKLKNKNINTKPFLNSLKLDTDTKITTTSKPNAHHDIFDSLVSDEKTTLFSYPDDLDSIGESSPAYTYTDYDDYDFNTTADINNSLEHDYENTSLFHAIKGIDITALRRMNKTSVKPPIGLKAVIVRHMFVTLSWERPESDEEITGYAIVYKIKGSQRERVSWSAAGHHEITIPGLTPNTTYEFTAITVTENGVSEPAPWVVVSCGDDEPVWGAVTGVRGAGGRSSLHLHWRPPHGAPHTLRYRVHLTHLESGVSSSQWTGEGATEISIGGLAVGPYRVEVSGAGGQSASPLYLNVSRGEVVAPPQNLTATADSDTSVSVSWSPSTVTEVTGYKVRFKPAGGGRKADSLTTPGDVTTVKITDLLPHTTYQIRVCAVTSDGCGPMSEWVSVTTSPSLTHTDDRVPDAPPPLTTRAGRDWISVWWGAGRTTGTGWEVGWGRGVPDDHLASLAPHVSSHIIRDLVPNSEYVISLRASNSLGLGPAVYATVRTSPAASLDDLDEFEDFEDGDDDDESDQEEQEDVLIPPLGLKAIMLSGTTAVVYWTDPTLTKDQPVSDGRRYVVRYAAVGGRARTLNVSDLSCMIDDLTPYTDYEFTVKLIKGGRTSPWSLVLVNRTLPAAPDRPPLSLTPSDVTSRGLALSWTPPHSHSPLTGYVILYAAVGPSRPPVESVSWSSVTVGPVRGTRLDRLRPDTTYYLRIQAKTAAGLGPPTDVIEATTLPESMGGLAAATSAWLWASAGGAVAVLALAAVLALSLCCRRRQDPPLHDTSTYQKSSASTGIKPPDLWIHHDQMELKHMDKNMHNSHISSGSVDGGGLMSSTLTLPRPMDYSLDRRIHVPTYVDSRWSASCGGDHSDSDETAVMRQACHTHTARDCTPMTGAGCGATCDRRPPHTLPRHHDQSTPLLAPPPLSSPPSSLASLHHTHTCGVTGVCGDVYAAVGRERGHYVAYEPLTHYAHRDSISRDHPCGSMGRVSVGGAASTASQLHSFVNDVHSHHSTPSHGKGSLRETSPFKKSASSSPGHNRLALGPTPALSSEVEPLTPSRSTERLHQEMENLHGLMKDLSAITHRQYDC